MIICIFMPNIKAEHLTPALKMITKTVTCLKWPLDPDAQKVFWLKLQEGLQKGTDDKDPTVVL